MSQQINYRTMRLLLIAPGYLPYTFSENLCNGKLVYAMYKRGWHVDVISKVDEGPSYSNEWTEPWLPLKETNITITYEVGGRLARIYDTLRSSFKMGIYPEGGIRWACRAYELALKLCKENHYDAVLTRSPNDIPHVIGLRLKEKLGIRWIANWNDPAAPIWPEPYTHHFSAKEQARKDWVGQMLAEYNNDYAWDSEIVLRDKKHKVLVAYFECNLDCNEHGYGIARCSSNDKFDKDVGLAVAFAHFRGYPIPDFV